MGLFSKDIQTMDDLFLHLMQDIYYAEKQILKALPDMVEKATNRELTTAFKAHLATDHYLRFNELVTPWVTEKRIVKYLRIDP